VCGCVCDKGTCPNWVTLRKWRHRPAAAGETKKYSDRKGLWKGVEPYIRPHHDGIISYRYYIVFIITSVPATPSGDCDRGRPTGERERSRWVRNSSKKKKKNSKTNRCGPRPFAFRADTSRSATISHFVGYYIT